MNTKSTLRRKLTILLGVVALIVLALIVPSPLHDWFVGASIAGIPVRMAIVALIILFTPPAILSTILRNFDVDYDDEDPKNTSLSGHMHNVAMHSPM